MSKVPPAAELLRHSLDLFLAKDMKGWSLLCADDGEVLTNGNPYEMSYATFVTFKGGLIVNYREYWDPLTFMQALGSTQF